MSVPQANIDAVRGRLFARRQALTTREHRVRLDLARQFDPLVADSSDQAIQLQNDEALQAIGEAAVDEIAAIDLALRRLDSGQYGICGVCGEEIQPARLRAVPHAVTCAACVGRRSGGSTT